MHLHNIYAEVELDEAATCKELLQVQAERPRILGGTLEAPMSDDKTTMPVSLAEIVRRAVEAHERTSRLFAEPAASQAAGESIRDLVEAYRRG